MRGLVVDTSVWIDYFAGDEIPGLEAALAGGIVVLAPLVAAELVSGAARARDRRALAELIAELVVHEAPLAHWLRVGELRRELQDKGLAVSVPDAHVVQCALDRDAPLLARDAVFSSIATLTPFELYQV
ncbi:MAG TPA: PIN domain-containing protein [Thermoanaerobaculia bacterium]|nr:PIN domain-containing protein [Thermoanaerobaculia bacterium]